jgi:hypothetical protein
LWFITFSGFLTCKTSKWKMASIRSRTITYMGEWGKQTPIHEDG